MKPGDLVCYSVPEITASTLKKQKYKIIALNFKTGNIKGWKFVREENSHILLRSKEIHENKRQPLTYWGLELSTIL